MLVIMAALLIELTATIMYRYARQAIQKEVVQRAEYELQVKNLEIQKVMVAVESATINSIWTVEQTLSHPDSLTAILRRLVTNNQHIIGASVVFVADYYAEKGHWFEPYVAKRANGVIEESQIGGPDHDYLQSKWFREGLSKGRNIWSEPYYDEAGAKSMLCTFLAPVHDNEGRIAALLGADVSLNWLSSTINASQIYPSSYNIMISRTGQLMVYPVDSLIMKSTIQEATANFKDTIIRRVNRQMMSGQSGQDMLINEKGEKEYIFYAPVEGDTGWSLAIVCNDNDIYNDLRMQAFNLRLLIYAGLILLVYIIWRMMRNARRLQATQSRKEAIEHELSVAGGIQKSLLPKVFPPYPERSDIDIHAILVPAHQVGGDLYDFHIRDEKLFFCIGDVSGKGVPASLVMAITRTLFRSVTSHESSPKRILAAINDMLAADNTDDIFVTFVVGVIDLPTGQLRYASAGHEPPILIGQGQMECNSNLPLGAMPGWKFIQQETTLPDEATLFLFTDGLTEAMNASHTLFGKRRMMEVADAISAPSTSGNGMQHSVTISPRDIIERMNAAVEDFVVGAEQSDDLTMLAIHYSRPQTAIRLSRTITLRNDVQNVPQLNAFVSSVSQAIGLDPSVIMKINLAVEEAVVNVMSYAYPEGTVGDILVQVEADNERIKIIITDSGVPFDPTSYAPADTTLSVEERPIGGLGIHLVRHYMDSINYERVDDQNVLTIIKRLK